MEIVLNETDGNDRLLWIIIGWHELARRVQLERNIIWNLFVKLWRLRIKDSCVKVEMYSTGNIMLHHSNKHVIT